MYVGVEAFNLMRMPSQNRFHHPPLASRAKHFRQIQEDTPPWLSTI
jgi:hypothetical protein